ncbi:hypothetical protein [Limnohabitans sp. T6-5]|uniref:hypothetical protein n=1 Tax=Limnohabitans sp. T6-5 TaxID=1100724 RepID=UPI0011B273FC|nr:hypothetical protein [Limnohabitans sp. T6-5]
MTESAMMAKDSISPKKHMCAQSPFLAVIGSIKPKNDSCAQSLSHSKKQHQAPKLRVCAKLAD